MWQTEVKQFFIIGSIAIAILISGLLVFLFQYRRRRMLHEQEKKDIERQHKLELLNTQLEEQQKTMQFIGSEIHDSVAQKLTLAAIYSQRMEFENQFPGAGDELKRISTIINDSLMELRSLSKTLSDNNLQFTDLDILLRQECERVNDTGICRAILIYENPGRLNVTIKSFLYRIVQEFIQNSLKHAECKLITIVVEEKAGELLIKLADDGHGFKLADTHSAGMGLNNMKRRIQMIGGMYSIESSPETGTRLSIRLNQSPDNTINKL